MTPHEILGVSATASEEQIKKAYRKQAMKHHPDREGGNEALFKQVKEAYEELEKNGWKAAFQPRTSQGFPGTPGRGRQWEPPKSPGNTWRDKDSIGNIFEDLKAANRAADRRNMNGPDWSDMAWDGQPKAEYSSATDVVARVGIREAFAGFNLVMPKRHRGGQLQNHSVHIPPGTPNGYRGTYKVSDGSSATVITRIDSGKFKLRSLGDSALFSAGVRCGDIEMDVEVNSIDLILGAWIEIQDFLGEHLRVRIPEAFDPRQRLKVAGKGYYGWIQEHGRPSNQRADMYLKVIPIFKKPTEAERDKLKDLYKDG